MGRFNPRRSEPPVREAPVAEQSEQEAAPAPPASRTGWRVAMALWALGFLCLVVYELVSFFWGAVRSLFF